MVEANSYIAYSAPEAGRWERDTREKIAMLRDDLVKTRIRLRDEGASDSWERLLCRPVEQELEKLYEQELPLAKLRDSSDLLLRIEGPAVADRHYQVSAVKWLNEHANKAIKSLAKSLFVLLNHDAKSLEKGLDIRLTGMAAGSLNMGFLVQPPPADLIPEQDEYLFENIKKSLGQMANAPRFVGRDTLSPKMREHFPDPAERDAILSALYTLAPTGRSGIHTLHTSAHGSAEAELSNRERVVLKDALERPDVYERKEGAFVGTMVMADISGRFNIRLDATNTVLRCIIHDPKIETIKDTFANQVRVSGRYESDDQGRPRLMYVHSIERVPDAEQQSIPDA